MKTYHVIKGTCEVLEEPKRYDHYLKYGDFGLIKDAELNACKKYHQAEKIDAETLIERLQKENDELTECIRVETGRWIRTKGILTDTEIELQQAKDKLKELEKEKDLYFNKAVEYQTNNDLQAEKLIEQKEVIDETNRTHRMLEDICVEVMMELPNLGDELIERIEAVNRNDFS